ncbi:MAG: response regulator transcription factor [Sulfuritalea sp.]|nr:response regulator transcription factor [Sulfuritalea sp.]MDP1983410.1 response regulator transcription factor [Sulfuritalea sp.]
MKILLVEDSRMLRERLRGIIGTIPLASVVAETDNADEARCLLDQHRPEVAVIDLRLRNGSGLSLLVHAKAMHSATTLIVLTNYAQAEYRTRCIELGAHYFFDKSKGIDAFIRLLTDLSRLPAEPPGAGRIDAP